MKQLANRLFYSIVTTICLCITYTNSALARVGGGGGHSSGGSHSSSSHSSSSYHSSSYSTGSGGGGSLSVGSIIVVLLIVLVLFYLFSKNKGRGPAVDESPVLPAIPFPDGLDAQKVGTSFMAIQDAWSRKDLKEVRKWLSDGMYQRLTTQFAMMNKLEQKNTLSNIRITRIAATNTIADSNYSTVEVAISFAMDDSFSSARFPQFNENFAGDADTEYWTFIKRVDSVSEKNLYDNNNCPNCGAPFEVKMGEISRCSNCNTLTNSAAYDWVLSEITQAEAYTGGAGLATDNTLKEMFRTDPFFAVQRMEDIASNVFMQSMLVMAGGDKNKLGRFADEATEAAILKQKDQFGPFLFDRLYMDNLSLESYKVDNNVVTLSFDLNVNYRRVKVDGNKAEMIDRDFVTQNCSMQLSRNQQVFSKAGVGETVYSHECSNCGAPFTDTTKDTCSYCDAPVLDKKKNWVLTGLLWGAIKLNTDNGGSFQINDGATYSTNYMIFDTSGREMDRDRISERREDKDDDKDSEDNDSDDSSDDDTGSDD